MRLEVAAETRAAAPEDLSTTRPVDSSRAAHLALEAPNGAGARSGPQWPRTDRIVLAPTTCRAHRQAHDVDRRGQHVGTRAHFEHSHQLQVANDGRTRDAGRGNSQSLLRPPDPELSLRVLPKRHWELDEDGPAHPEDHRNRAAAPSSSRRSRSRRSGRSRRRHRQAFVFDEGKGLSTEEQQYDPTSIINEVRSHVDAWRSLPNPEPVAGHAGDSRCFSTGGITSSAAVRPFFCQVEAVETAIWLTEVAPAIQGRQALPRPSRRGQQGRQSRTDAARAEAGHRRGQDHRHGHAHRLADDQCRAPPGSKHFTRGFLVVHARPHDQGPPARPPAQRPGQLLRQPRTGARATCSTT